MSFFVLKQHNVFRFVNCLKSYCFENFETLSYKDLKMRKLLTGYALVVVIPFIKKSIITCFPVIGNVGNLVL